MYKHNDRPAEMFRAVRIVRPVKELSGNFSCEVQDDEVDEVNPPEGNEEQVASHELLIYGEYVNMNAPKMSGSKNKQYLILLRRLDNFNCSLTVLVEDLVLVIRTTVHRHLKLKARLVVENNSRSSD